MRWEREFGLGIDGFGGFIGQVAAGNVDGPIFRIGDGDEFVVDSRVSVRVDFGNFDGERGLDVDRGRVGYAGCWVGTDDKVGRGVIGVLPRDAGEAVSLGSEGGRVYRGCRRNRCPIPRYR